MRSVAGVLGKTQRDGGSDKKPLKQLIPHLNQALAKPAADERLIFIDLNAEPEFAADSKPTWHDPAVARLERFETNELNGGRFWRMSFVTNMGFHRKLDDVPMFAAAPFGLGMPDYNRPGHFRLSEMYRQKQKHIDAHSIGTAMLAYTKFPSTFDGGLPSEAFGAATSRVKIGESYFFKGIGRDEMVGLVTSATVNDAERKAYLGVSFTDGVSQILQQPMTDAEYADYQAHPDAYFGRVMPVAKKIEKPYELFEWFMETHKSMDRATLLQRLGKPANFDPLGLVRDTDLLAEYCEALVAAVPDPQNKK